MAGRIQLRRGTAANWTSANPVLAAGEVGVETDTGRAKVGTGATAWTSLPYIDAVNADHPGDTTNAHAASAIGFTPVGTIAADDVQEAVAEVATDAAAALTAHLDDTVDAHDASAISYAGSTSLAATTVEAALDELDSEKVAAATLTTDGDILTRASGIPARVTRADLNVPTYFMPAPNGTNDTTAMDDVITAALAASPYRNQLVMRAGTYKRTTPMVLNVGYMRLIGAGMEQTILSFSGSSGYAIDATGTPSFADFTIDGTSATGSAGAFRLGADVKNVKCEDIAFKNFNTTVAAVSLLGASQNEFDHCFWSGNFRNLALVDSGAYAPNENAFHGCNLGNTVGATGAAITITNGEANTFDECLIQSVQNINTIHINNTAAATGVLSRGNRIVGNYFEENGNSQSSSRGIYVEGASGRAIAATIIRDNRFFQSAQNNPSRQIELTYTTSTVIDGNYANLGGPHVITYDGGNNITPLVGDNAFTGAQQIARTTGPASSLYLPGSSGNYVATPDSAALSLSGDCEIVFLIAPNDWTPAAEWHVISKDTASGGGRSWAVSVTALGMGKFWWAPDGTSLTALTSGVAFGFADGAWGWGRITFDADNGASGRTARFYKQVFTSIDEPTEWTLLDTQTSAGATSIGDTTTEVEIGAFAGGVGGSMFPGKIGKVIVRNALSGGTTVASADFTAPRGTRHRDSAGNTWTINGSAWAWSA